MKKSSIQVGGVYVARVSGKLTEVRVDAINERGDFCSRTGGYHSTDCFDVTNLATGRKLTFRSAEKFRYPVQDPIRKLANGVAVPKTTTI